jgi:hypothetical protein
MSSHLNDYYSTEHGHFTKEKNPTGCQDDESWQDMQLLLWKREHEFEFTQF